MNYILLVQSTASVGSRIWETFQTEAEMLQALIGWFEDELRQKNRHKESIDYSVKDFLDYLNKMKELVCLSFDSKTMSFLPNTKQHIKERAKEFFIK